MKCSRKTKYVIIVICTLVALLLLKISCTSSARSSKEIACLLGISSAEIESFDSYKTGAIGEYYIVEKYHLSENTIEEFTHHSSFILGVENKFVIPPKRYVKYDWERGPVDSLNLSEIYEMGFTAAFDTKAIKWVKEAKKTARTCDAYCAFQCEWFNKELDSVCAYVLDIKQALLYIIVVDL